MVGIKSFPFTAFSMATSQDLIHWTPSFDFLPITNLPQGQLLYPTLIDPTDPSRNFENTGQEPYLYFTAHL